jgi:hypothetical protein
MRMQSEISHTFWGYSDRFSAGFIVMFAFHEIMTFIAMRPFFFKKDWEFKGLRLG